MVVVEEKRTGERRWGGMGSGGRAGLAEKWGAVLRKPFGSSGVLEDTEAQTR